jgi:hypothetical protein
MNRSVYISALLALSGTAAIALRAQTPATAAVAFIDPANADAAEIRALGERVIAQLGATLLNEVSTAMAQNGPEKAIEVCHLKALPLSRETLGGQPRITAIKRTSLRVRNSANTPDAAEQLALTRAVEHLAAGSPPAVLIQTLTVPDKPVEWRVYRPVMMAPACVTCHGPRENLAPAVRTRLAALYPDDQATGYAEGDWRGLIRVSVLAEPASQTPPPSKR